MKIITISREYGAGGHSIAKKVASELGLDIYDKDIIRNTAAASGIDVEQIKNEEEIISRGHNFIRAITPMGYDPQDVIRAYQQQVILDLAAKGPCVMLGRCADAILRANGIDCLNVFIYADELHRAERAKELLGTTDLNEIKREIAKKDRGRHAYYTHYTGNHWGDCRNFNLCLDSGVLGYDLCAKIICDAAKATG